MRQVRDATAGILDNVTLSMVTRNIDEAKAAIEPEEPLMYYI